MRKVLGSVGLAAQLAFAPAAGAQTDDASRATARDLATAGVEAYEHGEFGQASAKLEKAYALLRAPSVGLWSARALVQVGKLLQASERYREVARLDASVGDSSVQSKAVAEANAELEALTPRLPRVIVRVEGAGSSQVELEVDGTPMNRVLLGEAQPLDPGTHRFVARKGNESATAEIAIGEGERRDVVLRFGPHPAASPPAASGASTSAPARPEPSRSTWTTRKTLAVTSAAFGLAGIGVGTYFGLKAKSKLDRADELGCDRTCPSREAYAANEDARQAGTVSTVAVAIGAVTLAGGIVLYVTADSSPTQVGLSAQGGYVRGTW